MKHPPLPFIDLAAQRRRLGDRIDRAIAGVLDHGAFILGPEVAALEKRLAEFCGARHAIACANGTDALVLALMARGIGPGDAVLVPAFTFTATAEAVRLVGAVPVFIDVRETDFTLDPLAVPAGVREARRRQLRPRAVIPVDLFGLPADYDAILPVCAAEGLVCIADAAQSFGGRIEDRPVGGLAPITTVSFFPAKPLGCYGDGGALFTNDDLLAERLRSLHQHGRGSDKYDNVHVGLNSRLDTIQAAILLEKLAIFPDEIAARRAVAARYREGMPTPFKAPEEPEGRVSVWAQYSVRVSPDRRDRVRTHLASCGIPTMCYYPIPLHRQVAYRDCPRVGECLPVSETLAASLFSLPMHPYLEPDQQDRVLAALHKASHSVSGAPEQ